VFLAYTSHVPGLLMPSLIYHQLSKKGKSISIKLPNEFDTKLATILKFMWKHIS
jgi:hypothetical protein